MPLNHPTDLEVAENLELLSSIVNESIERATKVLEKAKEIDEVKILIQEICDSRQSLELKQVLIQEIEESATNKLKEVQIISEELQDLKRVDERLHELGISKELLREFESVLYKLQEAKKEASNTRNESEKLMKQSKELSEKIDTDIQHIERLIADYSSTLDSAQATLKQLTSIWKEIGGMGEIKKLLGELTAARIQLEKSRQEIIAVRSLENYLQEFTKRRDHKQLRRWLWKELGFAGVFIYFLSLIIPNSKKLGRR